MEDKVGHSRPRVAVFRPAAEAARSAAFWRALGYCVALAPALEIEPVPAVPKRACYDAVIATSANAFLADAPVDRTVPIYVVGAQTARAAQERGWRVDAPPAPDSERLAATLKARLRPGASVLYLAGRDRRDGLERALSPRVRLEVVETYAAEARRAWTPAEIEAVAACGAALHYSRRSAEAALKLAEQAGLLAKVLAMSNVCLADNIAEALTDRGARNVAVAEQPDEAHLAEALGRALPVFPSR